MSVEERIRKARALLKDASRAFEADDVREGSRLMWEASKSAISAVAEQRGWPHESYDDLRQVIYHLDHDGDPPLIEVDALKSYFGKFVMADMYLEHAVIEDGEWDCGDEFRVPPEELKSESEQVPIWCLIDDLADEISRYEASR